MKIKGFTPVSDKLIQELGLMTAVIYGKIWRYCDAYGSCEASKKRLADELNISERTIYNHLKVLCDNKYITITSKESGADEIKITNKISYKTTIEEIGTALDAGGTALDAVKDTPIDIKKDEGFQEKNAFKTYEQEIGVLSQTIGESIKYLIDEWEENKKYLRCPSENKELSGEVVVCQAIKIAAKNNARRMKYIETIVKNWIMHGYGWNPKMESSKKEKNKQDDKQKPNSISFSN